jgi:peptide chain release factor 1
MIPDLNDIRKKYGELLEKLGDPELISRWDEFEKLSREKEIYEIIIAKTEELEEIARKIEEAKTMLAAERDPELILLAEAELRELRTKETILREEVEELLKKKDENPEGESPSARQKGGTIDTVIMEIRAGVGGEEAALFAKDLFTMYSKYAQSQGWKQKIFDSNTTELGGFKYVIFEIRGQNAFEKLKQEAGIHRVQRIPKTEKSGRIHTSTCSVAVLPRPKKEEIKIRQDDLKIQTYRASGPGGQYVNKRETAVRITHIPTGIIVSSQTERSQLQNKENALAILEAKLFEKIQEEEEKKMAGTRRSQIGGAKRAEKIRTYNFPQDRITDHRIKKSWRNIEEILNGKLDSIIHAFRETKGKESET